MMLISQLPDLEKPLSKSYQSTFNYRPKVQDLEHTVFDWLQWVGRHLHQVN